MTDMSPDEVRAWLKLRLSPSQAGALTVYGEARNQSVSGLQAVLSVIRNRVESGRWGKTWTDVVLAPKQFSCWNEADPNNSILTHLGLDLLSATPRQSNPVFDACLWLSEKMVNKDYPSNVGDATHYYAPAVVDTPAWANAPAIRRTIIGAHAFYSNVR